MGSSRMFIVLSNCMDALRSTSHRHAESRELSAVHIMSGFHRVHNQKNSLIFASSPLPVPIKQPSSEMTFIGSSEV